MTPQKDMQPDLQAVLREKILDQLDLSRELTDDEIFEAIDETVMEQSKDRYISLYHKSRLRQEIFNSMRKLDILQELVDDSSITEIMVNGTQNIFIERHGSLVKWEKKFTSREKLEDVIQQIAAKSNRIVNESAPIVDARLDNGSRVNVVLSPVSIDGPTVTIRRFPDQPVQMSDLIMWGTISAEAAGFLEMLIIAGYNIFISGGTGSGKTTMLNALSDYIPKDERMIVIEDNAELQIRGVENLVRLEVRNANVEGSNAICIRDLIRCALRMRPDRIVVGEVRGEESVDMLQALNTGHNGSLSTGHSNSCKDMLSRLETMVLMGIELPLPAIRRQIASGIDIIIQLGRLRDKSRKVLEIAEIDCYEEGEIKLNSIYKFQEEGGDKERVRGVLMKTGSLRHVDKMLAAGIEYDRK